MNMLDIVYDVDIMDDYYSIVEVLMVDIVRNKIINQYVCVRVVEVTRIVHMKELAEL